MILWHQLIVTLIHHWHYKEEEIHKDLKILGLVSPVHGRRSPQQEQPLKTVFKTVTVHVSLLHTHVGQTPTPVFVFVH